MTLTVGSLFSGIGLTLALNAPDSPSSGKLKSILTVNESSPNTGPTFPDTETLPLWSGLPSHESIFCVGASPVKTLAMPGNAQASMERGQDSGVNTSEPLCSFDPATSSWRWDEYSETWPRAGMMRNGKCYPRERLEHLTDENESGFWPTPQKMDGQMKLVLSRVNMLRAGITIHEAPGKCSGGNSQLRDWCAAFPVGVPLSELLPILDSITGMLNPQWTEWLMGYPQQWTETER